MLVTHKTGFMPQSILSDTDLSQRYDVNVHILLYHTGLEAIKGFWLLFAVRFPSKLIFTHFPLCPHAMSIYNLCLPSFRGKLPVLYLCVLFSVPLVQLSNETKSMTTPILLKFHRILLIIIIFLVMFMTVGLAVA